MLLSFWNGSPNLIVTLKEHMEHAPGNAKYTLRQIQNEIVLMCEEVIREKILKSIAKYWSIMADETQDCSTTEQVSLCICSVKGNVTRFCACAASWFLFWRTFFQDWLLVKKSSSIDPETPEKAIISVFKSYLVNFGSLTRHILYFCASIVEKIQSHWGEVHEAMFVVFSVPTNGSSVGCNVVIWLSFLSIKFSSQRSTFSGYSRFANNESWII